MCERKCGCQAGEILDVLLRDTERDLARWLKQEVGVIDNPALPDDLNTQS